MMTNWNQLERRQFLILASSAVGGALAAPSRSFAQEAVSLDEAHKGTPEIDLRIMNQFGAQPKDVQDFYIACREALTGSNPDRDLADVCRAADRWKLGGPMLGDITATSVAVWMHLPEPAPVSVVVSRDGGGGSTTFRSGEGGRLISVRCEGLAADTAYTYQVIGAGDRKLGEGRFTTVPAELSEKPFRIAFGGDFHKIGQYRPELMKLVRERGSRAMLLVGDSAVDGRKNDFGLINTDYMLRNLSPVWQQLTAHVPVSATWDDHDYWGNDTFGSRSSSNQPIDVAGLRRMWKAQWNNPQRGLERAGIYFETRIGPLHFLALDTRSCRVNDQRGKRNSYLGEEQMDWLKQRLRESDAPFILISSGTMWSDYISAGKDSWGTWDTEGREEIFRLIDDKQDSRVLLLCGDRHGARGFAIPRPGKRPIHEFEVGTLGGVPGPAPFADDRTHQLFGLPSRSWAFGEFTFSTKNGRPHAVFRLINESGTILETVTVEA